MADQLTNQKSKQESHELQDIEAQNPQLQPGMFTDLSGTVAHAGPGSNGGETEIAAENINEMDGGS